MIKKTLKKILKLTRKLILFVKDPTKVNFTLYDLKLQTQINKKIDLNEDRISEIAEFYNISVDEIKTSYENLEDLNNKMINVLEKNFQDVVTDQQIMNALLNSTPAYIKNLMIGYTRLDNAFYLLNYFNCKFTKKRKSTLNVLDYGCAVADYGLAFALDGYNVTLCDIEGGNLEFAKFRFKKRNLNCQTIPVTENNMYPDFKHFDIIIAGEILEHLQNPLLACKKLHKSLPKGGYLWLSDYPFVEKDLVGDHLPGALDQRSNVLNFINNNFKLGPNIADGYLLRRK